MPYATQQGPTLGPGKKVPFYVDECVAGRETKCRNVAMSHETETEPGAVSIGSQSGNDSIERVKRVLQVSGWVVVSARCARAHSLERSQFRRVWRMESRRVRVEAVSVMSVVSVSVSDWRRREQSVCCGSGLATDTLQFLPMHCFLTHHLMAGRQALLSDSTRMVTF